MNQYRSHQKALRFIASILLIQRRVKHSSHEEKSAFTQRFSPIYARSLKDQVRKSKYPRTQILDPRTQILDPRTQSKLFCHSSITLYSYPEQQPNRGHFTKLYRNRSKAIQLSSPSYIALPTHPYTYMRLLCKVTSSLLIPSSLENRSLQAERFEGGKCKL